MQQTSAERTEEVALRRARAELIRSSRRGRDLSQLEAVVFINAKLRRMKRPPISRAHLANIETGRCNLTDPILQAIPSAFEIPTAVLMEPPAEISDAA